MGITSSLVNTFKTELLKGFHSFDTSGATPAGSVFKIALYTNSTTIDTTPAAYGGPSDEVASGGGYTTGGNTLTNTGVGVSTVTSFTARGCLIYNSSTITGLTTNAAVCGITFGGDKTGSSGTFTIQFPTNDSSDAIIRITS